VWDQSGNGSGSGVFAHDGNLKRDSFLEAEGFVDPDCADILGCYVQEGRFIPLENVSHDLGYQPGGVAAATEVGMRTHGAHFGESWHTRALAGHGCEFAILSNAEVRAELVGALAEGARVGQRSQGDHLGNIGWTELLDRLVSLFCSRQRTRSDHLEDIQAPELREASREGLGSLVKK
jgi:hypothetical protein